MKILKKIMDWFVFLLTGKGEIANEMVELEVLDLSGQGRDKIGR